MTLRNLHFDYGRPALDGVLNNPAGSYTEARNNLIKEVENSFLAQGLTMFGGQNISAIHDVRGNPTVGYGYDLTQRPIAEIEAFITHAFGGTLTTLQEAGLQLIRDFRGGDLTAAQLINFAQAANPNTPNELALASLRMTDTEATLLLNAALDGLTVDGVEFAGFEDELSDFFGEADVELSVERIALLSADYNANLVGNETRRAVQSDDP